jgi:putative cardiolipin synthase
MSEHQPLTVDITLTAAASALTAAHGGRSGVRLLPDGREAFAVRVHCARLAQRTLDIQTYICRNDTTGRFIAHELLCAADRGVAVRVLLDDMDARPRQFALEALDQHPNISVKLFNPFRTRSGWLRTVTELTQRGRRLNHRMHNKAWIADAQVAICGGRNIGNEYFAAADDINFIDLDVMLLGPAVASAQTEFDRYWECDLSKPISELRRYSRRRLSLRRVQEHLSAEATNTQQLDVAEGIRAPSTVATLLDRPFHWSASVRVVADDPRKAYGGTRDTSHVLESIVDEIRAASREVLLISPYFVPGMGGTAALRSLARQGARVQVLTNSLAATDVAIVHSGYTKYRAPLLQAGVGLFELKYIVIDDDRHPRFRLGSSRASLHTKAAIIDGNRVFVGSFNIDPRSADLNCEMGVWIGSRRLADKLRASFQRGTDPRRAFTVRMNTDGDLEWFEHDRDQELVHRREPHASWWRRAIARVLEALPIESQL